MENCSQVLYALFLVGGGDITVVQLRVKEAPQCLVYDEFESMGHIVKSILQN